MRSIQKHFIATAAHVLTLTLAFATVVAAYAADESTPQSNQPAANKGGATAAVATKAEIQTLIRDLASPQYTTRRAAASELRRIGADAFDDLFGAAESADPEVASSARYLLRQIAVRWVQNDDTAAVRRSMRSYGELPDDARLRAVAEIAKLPNREGLAALCRVVRYDRSPLVSRAAALAVIRPDDAASRRAPVDHSIIERELGNSSRTTADWIRHFQVQLRDPAASIAIWQKTIEEEAARLARNSDESKPEIQVGLLWNLGEVYRQLNDRPALVQTVDRIFQLDTTDPERVGGEILRWLVDEKSWDAVDDLLAKHQERFTKNKRILYWVAFARQQQGKTEQAEQLAEQASRIESSATFDNFSAAKELEIRGQYQWAIREYHGGIDKQPLGGHESILSRISLASMLHDHQDDKLAADVLEPLVTKLRTDNVLIRQYAEVMSFFARNYETDLRDRDSLSAQYHFYRACQYGAEQNWKDHKEQLKKAIELDNSEADVLIAMFRAPDTDQNWRNEVHKRITDLAQNFQKEIDDSPNDSHAYNQWAWLVSNTEGDFERAIEYSKKSLELNTDGESSAASYFDTLGRCYFAVGDFENAVKYERMAIDRVKYLQVMHRQLDQFEKALADKKAADRDGK